MTEINGSNNNEVLAGSSGSDVISGNGGSDTIYGGLGDDTLYGNNATGANLELDGNDVIYGEGGNDTIYGNLGNDNLSGGDGNDVIYGGQGNDTVQGDAGNDTLYGNESNDTIYGGSGDDLIYGGAGVNDAADGSDVLYGNSGNDTIYANGGDDRIYGNEGLDEIYGGGGNDTIYGGNGVNDASDSADTINGNEGNDTIYGNGGNDTLFGNEGNDTVYGGQGDDLIYGGNGVNDASDLSDNLYGNEGNDTIYGNGGNDYIEGGQGNDTIYGGQGDDSIVGQSGNDTLYGNDGNDVYWFDTGFDGGIGNDIIFDDSGSDTIAFSNISNISGLSFSRDNNDLMIIAGNGTIRIRNHYAGYAIENLRFSNGSTYSLVNMPVGGNGNDTLYGTGGNDIIYGNAGSDNIYGSGGNDIIYGDDAVNGTHTNDGVDTISGGSGSDTIYGNYGNDILFGNEGSDLVYGGHGDDTIYGGNGVDDASDSADKLSGNEGNDTIYGNGGNDTLFGNEGSDTLYGGQGDDIIYGGNGVNDASDAADFIDGNEGNDTIYGNAGNDYIEGGQGNDIIYGGQGNDDIVGQSGDDVLYGNEGNDVYWYDTGFDGIGNDTIIDDSGTDTIAFVNISNINELSLSREGNDLIIVTSSGIIRIVNQYAGSTVENLRFSNGAIYSLINLPLGTNGDDIILGNSGNDTIYGKAGSDNISGLGGDDTIYGGNGVNDESDSADILLGNEGNDTIYGNGGNDTLYGNEGGDTIYGGHGDDLIYGGNAINDLEDDGDFIEGNQGNDTIYGNGGDDVISGNEGSDTIYGGHGDDLIYGGGSIEDPADSADIISGNQGNDTIYGNGGNDTLYGNEGSDTIYGGHGDDLIYGGNAINDLEDDGDFIEGNQGNDTIYGNGGDDTISGGEGDDVIYGGKGDNIINGDAGNDKIYSDGNNDIISGGLGDDIFVIDAAVDGFTSVTISDFKANSNQDKIDLSLLNVGNFSDLTITQDGNDTTIKALNGGKIILENTNKDNITADDFINRSHQKILTVYNIGKPLDNIPNSVKSPQVAGKLTKFVIEDFNPKGVTTSRFDDAVQVIDITRFNVTNLSISDNSSGNAVVNLGDGQTLEIIGVKSAQLSEKNFITLGEDQQGSINEMLSKWDLDNEEINTKIVNNEDIISQNNGEVIYTAKANSLIFTNENIAPPTINIKVFNVDASQEGVHVIEGFDASNPLNVIDLSSLNIDSSQKYIKYEYDGDTYLHFEANESYEEETVVVKNTHAYSLPNTSLIGLTFQDFAEKMVTYSKMNSVSTNLYSKGEKAGTNDGYSLTNLDLRHNNRVLDESHNTEQYGKDLATDGWEIISKSTSMFDEREGFAVAMKNVNTGEIVITTRGTSNQYETMEDFKMAVLGETPPLIDLVDKFIAKTQQDNPNLNWGQNNVTLVGHSLGSVPTQVMGEKYQYHTVTYENPGFAGKFITDMGIIVHPELHIVIQSDPNFINTGGEQIVVPLVGHTDRRGTLEDADKSSLGVKLGNFFRDASDVYHDFTSFLPESLQNTALVNLLDPAQLWDFLYADNHLKEQTNDIAFYQALRAAPYWPVGLAEGLASTVLTEQYNNNNLTSIYVDEWLSKAASGEITREDSIPFQPGENSIFPILTGDLDTALNVLTGTILNIDNFVQDYVKTNIQDLNKIFTSPFENGDIINFMQNGIFSSSAVNSILADLINGKNLSEAIVELKDQFVAGGINVVGMKVFDSMTGNLKDKLSSELIKALPNGNVAQDIIWSIFQNGDSLKIMNDLPGNIATSLAMQAIQGKLDLDDSSLGYQIGMMIADAVVQAALISIGMPKEMSVVVMSIISEPLMQVFDFVGDVGEEVWKFLGNPFNSIINSIDPDKFSMFEGTDAADLMIHDGDHQITHLKSGDDIFFGWEGWNIVFGESGNDIIYGGNGTYNSSNPGNIRPDELYAGAGDDYVNGLAGDDEIYGGAGSDHLIGGAGNDFIAGGDYDRTRYAFFNGNAYYNSTTGVDGDDIIEGGLGSDTIIGGDGNNISSYKTSTSSVNINLGAKDGNGIVYGSGGDAQGDRLYEIQGLIGSIYNDNLTGDALVNYLEGNAGNDIIIGNGGSDFIYGGDGNDLIYGGNGINDPSDSADTIYGNEGNDTIYGNGGDDKLFGNEGSDTIYGGVGNDVIYGGNSVNDSNDVADTIYGNEGNDTIYGNGGDDSLFGNEGSDTIYGGFGNDIIYGGNGVNDISDSADSIYGNEGNDTIYGNGGDDILLGNEGSDIVYGGFGNDLIYGGNSVNDANDSSDNLNGNEGNDTIYGNGGDDTISGNEGSDTIYGGFGNDVIYGNDVTNNNSNLDGDDNIYGNEGDDILSGNKGNDTLSGGSGNDIIYGGEGDDIIYGNDAENNNADYDGDDLIYGGFGNDIIRGNRGNDSIYGGDGDDILQGDSGNDFLAGDSGNDVYYMSSNSGNDIISDTSGSDTIKFIDIASVNELSFTKLGDDLIITFYDKKITIQSHFTTQAVERLQFSDNNIFNLSSLSYETLNLEEDESEYDSCGYVLDAPIIDGVIVNNAPVAMGLSNYNINQNQNFAISIPEGSFLDLDGDVLTYSAKLIDGSDLPSCLTFENGVISGVANNNNVGNYEISITATDTSGDYTEQNFTLNVVNINDAPTASLITSNADQNINQITLSFQGSDIDIDNGSGDSLTYEIITNPSSGLVTNNNDGTFTFNLNNEFQHLSLGETQDVFFLYKAIDASGASSRTTAAVITITGTNDAPTASNISVTIAENSNYIITTSSILKAAEAFDIDGDSLSVVSVQDAQGGSVFLNSAGNIIFTPLPTSDTLALEQERIGFTYTISDGKGAFVTKNIDLTISQLANNAPVATSLIDSVSGKFGNLFTYTIPEDVFIDEDNDILTYSATLSDGSALPDWLIFNQETKTFTGTPPLGIADTLSILLIASDAELSASQTFNLDILSNVITGTSNNDTIHATSDNDEIYGGEGDDQIIGGAGADIIYGGRGNDVARYEASKEAITINLETNINTGGDAQGDTLFSIENILATSYDDNITGDSKDNTIYANSGDDIVNGGAGNDVIYGGKGSDIINGGAGKDILFGGSGNDIFTFTALEDSSIDQSDLISDFSKGQDKINLSNLGFINITDDQDQTDGSVLTYEYDNDNNQTYITNEANTFKITLNGIISLDVDDFYFG
jgi:Ca2+-binding RTX toxin-like protein